MLLIKFCLLFLVNFVFSLEHEFEDWNNAYVQHRPDLYKQEENKPNLLPELLFPFESKLDDKNWDLPDFREHGENELIQENKLKLGNNAQESKKLYQLDESPQDRSNKLNNPVKSASALQELIPVHNEIPTHQLQSPPEQSNSAKEKAKVRPFAGKVISYSGFLTVNKDYKSNIFFWLIESERKSQKTDPLVLWLQGGPGESSLVAAFAENGPYKIVNGKVELSDHSWTKFYNVLYLDNPVGAGFSYTKSSKGNHKNINSAVVDIKNALLLFYDMFPEYKNNRLFFAGEDYGGKYLPPLAQLIHEENQKSSNTFKIPLKGLIIGAGFLDPVNQLDFSNYYYQAGIVDNNAKAQVEKKETLAKDSVKNNNHVEAKSHRKSIESKVRSFGYWPSVSMLEPDFDLSAYNEAKKFLKRKDVKKDLHADGSQFKNGKRVLQNFKNDLYNSVSANLSEVLNADKYRVLLYTGQCDLVTPHTQMDTIIDKLSWGGVKSFWGDERLAWKVNNKIAAYCKQYTYLKQCMIRKANHLIVRSQPEWTLALIKSFID